MNKRIAELYPDADTLDNRTDYANGGQGNRNAQTHDIHHEGNLIAIYLRGGNHFTVACRMAGVNVRTAQRWFQLGKLGLGKVTSDGHVCREEHVWFYDTCQEALAEVEAMCVEKWMREIARGNWRAARDFLTWRFPNRWGHHTHRETNLGNEGLDEVETQMEQDDPLRDDPQDPPIESEASQPNAQMKTEGTDTAEITPSVMPDEPADADESVESTPTPAATSPLSRHVHSDHDSHLATGDEEPRDNLTSPEILAHSLKVSDRQSLAGRGQG